MGIEDNPERLNELTQKMPSSLKDYFKGVVRMHKGKFGICWPLPFKKFSLSIRAGLQGDTLSYLLQESIGRDFGFISPKLNQRTYNSLIEITKKKLESGKNLKKRCFLPAAYFYLSGLQAYAQEVGGDHVQETVKNPDYILPALTATTLAGITAEDSNDPMDFIIPWFTTFTTLV